MPITSYAQNFEDVMLWRALKDVEKGFYIDVGANDPTVDSVSRSFYEKGWRGVHVEPSPAFAEKLRIERPDEIVEQVLISKDSRELKFYNIEGTGLSTANYEIAKRHSESGFHLNEITVPSVTLDNILETYPEREIHWLKIDVEGFEREVLESWKESDIRPWILLVESTRPLSDEESYHDWEGIILDKNYIFTYFDGLNRYYVHESKADLMNRLSVPPNVFDDFILSGQASNTMCLSVLQQRDREKAEKAQAEERARDAEVRASQALARAVEAEESVKAILESRSWRITAPIRAIGKPLKGLAPTFKNRARPLIQHAFLFVYRRPWLRRQVARVFRRLPALKNRLVGIARQRTTYQDSGYLQLPLEAQQLTPHARRIYQELEDLVGKNRKLK